MNKKLYALKKFIKENSVRALITCYALTIGFVLTAQIIGGAVNFALTKTVFKERSLSLDDFELVDAEYVDSMKLINASDDTQIIYTGNVRNVYIRCNFTYDPGEFVAYYSKNTEKSFRGDRPVYRKMQGDYYVFTFPLNTKQVRIDTGVYPSITVTFSEITANRSSFNDLLGFSTGELFYLFISPAAILAAVYTFLEFYPDGKENSGK